LPFDDTCCLVCAVQLALRTHLDRAMKSSPFIFAVYRMLRAVELEAGMDGLDARTKALLLLIADGDLEGTALSVGDLTRTGDMGTAPTVYNALNALESEGWIERRPDENDARTRRLRLTDRAKKIFGRMSAKATRALRGK
jgi:DNA-binding MarR family transcriptional regulator